MNKAVAPFQLLNPESGSSFGESIDFSWKSKSSTTSIMTMLEEESHSSQAFPIAHLLNKNDPNDLVEDLGLTKKPELLTCTLK